MSKIADKIEVFIRKTLPTTKFKREHYVVYQNTKLLFDFFIPTYRLLIEVQGIQHFEFNPFYHKSSQDLMSQKFRDTLKTQFVEEEGYKLLILRYDEIDEMNFTEFKSKLLGALK